MRYVFLSAFLYFVHNIALSEWSKSFGGYKDEIAFSISSTQDTGCILGGYTQTFTYGGWETFVIKLNSIGNIEWAKTFGGTQCEQIFSVKQTKDEGFICAGWTLTFGQNPVDFFILKLTPTGTIEWSKACGGINDDEAYSVSQTSDSGYIVAGWTLSFGAGSFDFLLVKLSKTGNVEWSKTFGGANEDYPYSVKQTYDGGYIVGGCTRSFGSGYFDFLVIKLDTLGEVEWKKTFGGSDDDVCKELLQTPDSGYILVGYTGSFGAGYYDVLVIKLNSIGDIEWSKTFGGQSGDFGRSIELTFDGGYILSGYTLSFGSGEYDVLVIKLDSTGNKEWAKVFGGANYDEGYAVSQLPDSSYIVGGYTSSYGNGNKDFLVMKINKDGSMHSNCPLQDVEIIEDSLFTIGTTTPSLVVSSQQVNIVNCLPQTLTPTGIENPVCGVGIEEKIKIEKKGFEVSPTIATKQIKIKIIGEENVYKIEIIDIIGRKIDTINCSKEVVYNVSKLKPGLYFLQIKQYNMIKKFVVI